MMYYKQPSMFRDRLKLLHMLTSIPHATVHVVRNPYDMIATVAMFQASSDVNNVKVTASIDKKFQETRFLNMAADIVLSKADAVARMSEDCQLDVLEVHLEDLIADPGTEIRRMCDFLGVACPQEYIAVCTRKMYEKASHSRDMVQWPQAVRHRIDKAIKQYSFFQQYSFES